MKYPIILLITFLVAVSMINGCGSSSSDVAPVVTQEKVEQYSVALGETETFENDHSIYSNTTATIMGTLRSATDAGQNIIIEAEGNITVSGSIIAGDGSTDVADGGTVTLYSKNGNIVINAGAQLFAGNGMSPSGFDTRALLRSTTLSNGGRGGQGGSLILRAPNGSITVAVTTGVLNIGNGGNGADVGVHAEGLNTFNGDDVTLTGGDSGSLVVDSNTIIGLDYTEETITEDILDDEGNLLLPSGEKIYLIAATEQINGGIGGDGGNLDYGLDDDEQSTWPQIDKAAVLVRSTQRELDKNPLIHYDLDVNMIRARAGDGGNGSRRGGDGGTVKVRGPNGVSSGENALDTTGYGGDGGHCHYGIGDIFDELMTVNYCVMGRGGDATVFGGDGSRGEDPDQKGGNGGGAVARPGIGGTYIEPLGAPFKLGKFGIGLAVGGNGGLGGNGCTSTPPESKGGDGGNGGYAHVIDESSLTTTSGSSTAVGGNGGDGNTGEQESGTPGKGGEAIIVTMSGNTAPGKDGVSYGTCGQTDPDPCGEDSVLVGGTCVLIEQPTDPVIDPPIIKCGARSRTINMNFSR